MATVREVERKLDRLEERVEQQEPTREPRVNAILGIRMDGTVDWENVCVFRQGDRSTQAKPATPEELAELKAEYEGKSLISEQQMLINQANAPLAFTKPTKNF